MEVAFQRIPEQRGYFISHAVRATRLAIRHFVRRVACPKTMSDPGAFGIALPGHIQPMHLQRAYRLYKPPAAWVLPAYAERFDHATGACLARIWTPWGKGRGKWLPVSNEYRAPESF